MKYDPIMCMMVDDTVKTKDAVPNGWKVTLEQNRNKQYVYSKAMTARGAELEAKKAYPESTVLNVERYNVSDVKTKDANTLDKAIKNCDSRVSHRNVVTSNIAFEEIKKMTGIIPEKVHQKGDTMEFYHSGVKVAEWDMNNAEVKVFV